LGFGFTRNQKLETARQRQAVIALVTTKLCNRVVTAEGMSQIAECLPSRSLGEDWTRQSCGSLILDLGSWILDQHTYSFWGQVLPSYLFQINNRFFIKGKKAGPDPKAVRKSGHSGHFSRTVTGIFSHSFSPASQ